MKDILDTVLLLALPASGKSEVRTFLAELDPEECRRDFHLGETVQIDDFPYVHLMRRIDEELVRLGREGVFFKAPDKPFADPWDWGTLIELLNEDYEDLEARRVARPASAARHLFDRLDGAAKRAGAVPKMSALEDRIVEELARALEEEAAAMLDEKHAQYPRTMEGRTVVIEFARGGPQGATMPLDPPFGYAHSLSMLSPRLLERSAILYIWVTPEESRRKNEDRADPDDPGSILHHGVPEAVMLGDYGCDDMEYLVSRSDRPGTVRIEAHGRVYHLPVAMFDNRVDRTSFVRKVPRERWNTADVEALHHGLKEAFDRLYGQAASGGS